MYSSVFSKSFVDGTFLVIVLSAGMIHGAVRALVVLVNMQKSYPRWHRSLGELCGFACDVVQDGQGLQCNRGARSRSGEGENSDSHRRKPQQGRGQDARSNARSIVRGSTSCRKYGFSCRPKPSYTRQGLRQHFQASVRPLREVPALE